MRGVFLISLKILVGAAIAQPAGPVVLNGLDGKPRRFRRA